MDYKSQWRPQNAPKVQKIREIVSGNGFWCQRKAQNPSATAICQEKVLKVKKRRFCFQMVWKCQRVIKIRHSGKFFKLKFIYSEKFALKTLIFPKTRSRSGFFSNFFKFLRYFSKKFEKLALKTLVFSKTGNGSKLFFTKFLMFWAL